ncbi:hypothetical protein BOX15_Mlig000730g4, partial [Macrostomum lignano]
IRVSWRWVLLWLAAPLAAGTWLGVLLEHCRCAGRQEALLSELIGRLSQLEAELRQLRLKLRARRLRGGASTAASTAFFYDAIGGGGASSGSDEFFDAESEAGNASAVMFSLADSSAVPIEDAAELLDKVDGLLESGEDGHREAHSILRDRLKKDRRLANQPEVLLRWAKACLQLHFVEASPGGNASVARDLLGQADAAAAQALELDTGSAECHAVRARTLGLMIRNLGIKDKVSGGVKFRQLVERGLELEPEHADLLELKACFLYEVSRVSWLERRTAAYLFGPDCLPEAKLEDAQRLMDRALAVRPGSVTALYWAARCRLESGQGGRGGADVTEALRLLRQAKEARVNGVEDRRLRDEAEKLLNAYA